MLQIGEYFDKSTFDIFYHQEIIYVSWMKYKNFTFWVFHVFVHGSDIRLSFSKLPLIRIHIFWPTKLIYAKQEESFWHDYVFLLIDLDLLWTKWTYYKENETEAIHSGSRLAHFVFYWKNGLNVIYLEFVLLFWFVVKLSSLRYYETQSKYNVQIFTRVASKHKQWILNE